MVGEILGDRTDMEQARSAAVTGATRDDQTRSVGVGRPGEHLTGVAAGDVELPDAEREGYEAWITEHVEWEDGGPDD